MRILAALAIVAQLCWPFMGALDQARAAGASGEQVICTLHGLMTVPAPADPAPEPAPAKPVCALCAAAAVALDGTPALPAAVLAAAERSDFLAFLPAPQRAPHSSPRPRAPPPFA